MKTYQNKVAVITGAGSGIGRNLAIQLARYGARLALSDVNMAGLEETRKMCLQAQQTCDVRVYHVDVGQRAAVFEHAAEVQRDFGTAHYIFNNAGYTLMSTMEHASIEEIEKQLAVCLWGVIYGVKAFLPMLLAQREGHIVNLSSIFGFAGVYAQGPYNMAKFGVRGLTECLWWELDGTGVQASCVHPGGIHTGIAHSFHYSKLANQDERRLQPLMEATLITPPQRCAADILKGVAAGKKRILTGYKSSTFAWITRLFPTGYQRLIRLQGGL